MHWNLVHIRKSLAARAPTAACLGIVCVLAAVLQAAFHFSVTPSLGRPTWEASFGLSWEAVSGGEPWRLLCFFLAHHSPLHMAAGVVGLYVTGRSVEHIVGSRHFLALTLLGSLAGGLAHCLAGALGWIEPGQILLGTWPMVFAVIGVYGTVLPGWRLGSAVRWRGARWWPLRDWAPRARDTAWMAAGVAALWWASGSFPVGGPEAALAGLGVGWAYTRMLGFGDQFFHQQITAATDLLEYRVEHMNWEEFVICELNPVLEKISQHGLRSLSAEERRILRYSRRKLEGW